MLLIIVCPSCQKKSENPYDKVPPGKLKLTCKGCGHQFSLDKEKQVNCRVRAPQKEKPRNTDGWKVEVPACAGMDYDLTGVIGLINSGLLGADDVVLRPGARQFARAGDIADLKEAFRKKAEALQRAERRGM